MREVVNKSPTFSLRQNVLTMEITVSEWYAFELNDSAPSSLLLIEIHYHCTCLPTHAYYQAGKSHCGML